MTPKAMARSAGLPVTADTIDVLHIRLAPGVPARVRRFAKFIREALVAKPGAPGLAAARLVALDGVRPSNLHRVQEGLPQLYVWQDLTHVEWQETDPPRRERRALSVMTLAALETRPPSRAPTLHLAIELQQYLEHAGGYAKFKPKERLNELERDALCWWYQCLPMALFFHVSGLQPLSAVSRPCLAREQTRLCPALPTLDDAAEAAVDTESCSELLDAAAMATGEDQSPTVLRRALDRMESAAKEPDGVARRRWVVELLRLRFDALQAGPVTALLIAWLVDLCESGTMQSEDPSKETPKRYFAKAAEPLLSKLRDLPDAISEWSVELLELLYRDLIDDELKQNPGGASAKSLATALNNFHAFLVEWFDVAPLRRRLHDAIPLVPVRANVVWYHEVNLAFGWIHDITDDRRLQTCLRVVLCIAAEAPARVTELLYLRVGNIRRDGEYLEIEIAPSLRYGRLKTRAAQRRFRITDPLSVALIWSWCQERKAAGAGDDALLFADPADRHLVYRRHTVSTLVTALLRAATGDPSTVGHDLRHTVLSDLNSPVLATSSIWTVNRLADNGTVAGHVTAATSLTHYTHLYELALRHRLDAALVMLIPITSSEAAPMLGVSALALRQQASRVGSAVDVYAWMRVREEETPPSAPRASAAWSWAEPVAPKQRNTGAFAPTVSISRLILASLASRLGAQEIASHFMLAPKQVDALRDAGLAVAHEITRYTWPDKYNVRVALPVGFEESAAVAGIDDLDEALHEKFARLHQWFTAEQDRDLLVRAFASWVACRIGGYLSLDQSTKGLGLLRLLAQAGVNPQALRVCYRAAEQEEPEDAAAFANAQREFAVAFGMRPRVWPMRPREWACATYLQWDSSDCIASPHAASGSIRGLDAWMLCLGAHLKGWNH